MNFRHEYKHIVNYADIYALRARLSLIAEHDIHCGTNGTYFIKSLYFDNYADRALREKLDGTDKREKFRIRYYGDDLSYMRLEKKSRINGLCSKESAQISDLQCQRIIEGDTQFLIDSENELFRELYAKMKYRILRPKCIVAYTRECFVYPQGNVRVTFDTDICGSMDINGFLNPDAKFMRAFSECVLEVKWDAYLPQIIRDAVQLKNRQSSAFSKYAAVRI